MSGPIVRTGTTPEFWKNYERIFGDKSAKKSADQPKAAAKSTKKTAAKKAVKKSAKKK